MGEIIRFPKAYREPPPEGERGVEPWDMPEPPPKRDPAALLAEIAEEFAAISAHLDAVRIGLVLLDHHYEDEP